MAQPPGIHARRAALKLLDAVLRRGETLGGIAYHPTFASNTFFAKPRLNISTPEANRSTV